MPIDVLDELRNLHQQAINEHSHYYTSGVVLRAIEEITRLRSAIDSALELTEAAQRTITDMIKLVEKYEE